MSKKILFLIFLTLLILQTQRTQQTFSQWYKQQIPGNLPVTGLKFIDTLNGWACTGNLFNPTQQDTAFILHTTNGGNNWLIQFSKTPFAFSSMTMVNNMVGYAFGDSLDPIVGRTEFFKTTNGGVNWFNISIPYNMWISQFYFLNPDTGWEAAGTGPGPDVRLTTNGGYTWQLRTSGITDYSSHCVFFLNYDTGWCGSGLIIYKTTNAGVNWIFSNGNIGNHETFSIFFLNENTGWVGLSADTITRVAYTSNSGLNWQIQYIAPFVESITDLYFYNNQLGWAGIDYTKIYKTTNSGINWGYQNDTSKSSIFSFVDSLHGWTGNSWTGNIGISHTSNGGGPITYVGIINLSNKIPEQYKLFQNFPNPFNPTTNIRFSLIKISRVRLNIYDVSGKEKVIWNSDKELSAGEHELNFDGSNFASGTYFYQIIVTDIEGKEVFRGTKKMILLK